MQRHTPAPLRETSIWPRLCIHTIKPGQMIEKHNINGKDVWVEIEQQPANRNNPHVIPTEYFTARYYMEEPPAGTAQVLTDEDGQPKLFESPVAALTFASKKLIGMV